MPSTQSVQGAGRDAERALREVVELQTQRIAELEDRLSKGTLTSRSVDATDVMGAKELSAKSSEEVSGSHQDSILIQEHERTIAELQRLLHERETSHAKLYQEYQEQLSREGQKRAAEDAAGDLRSYILDLEARNKELALTVERITVKEEGLANGRIEELQRIEEA